MCRAVLAKPARFCPDRRRKCVWLPVSAASTANWRLNLRTAGGLVSRRTSDRDRSCRRALLPAIEFRKLIVAVGDSTLAVEEVGKSGGVEPKFRPVAARLDDARQLPTQSSCYEGIEAVILAPADRKSTANSLPTAPEIKALDQWVRMGGRLVLCVGSRRKRYWPPARRLSFRSGPVGKDRSPCIRPGRWRAYCEAVRRHFRLAAGGCAMRVPRLGDIQGIVEAREANLPLVVRTACGLWTSDFRGRRPRPAAAGEVVRPAAAGGQAARHVRGRDEESGENCSHDALRLQRPFRPVAQPLDRFDGVRLTPFWLVAALIVGVHPVGGPGDYFLLRKLIGRMSGPGSRFHWSCAFASLGGLWAGLSAQRRSA